MNPPDNNIKNISNEKSMPTGGAYVRTATETNLCTYTHIPTFTYRNLFTHSSPIEICIISVLVK